MASVEPVSRMKMLKQRLKTLHENAYAVRQRALADGSEIDGWRISRLMRDAMTSMQASIAERKFVDWLLRATARKRDGTVSQ